MSDPLQFTYESMPALWLCYYDPEGPVGHGKTKAEALGDLFDMCDDDHGGPLLLGAIVAAIPGDARVVAHPDVLAPARELLYLYDWRPKLARMEESAKDENGGCVDDRKKVAKLLREYGERKKAGWIALRAALDTPSEVLHPLGDPMDRIRYLGEQLLLITGPEPDYNVPVEKIARRAVAMHQQLKLELMKARGDAPGGGRSHATVEWIKVEDRLPETQKMVLLWMVNGHRGPVEMGFRDFADYKFKIMVMGGWDEANQDGYGFVTHWALPPEGPTSRYLPRNPESPSPVGHP